MIEQKQILIVDDIADNVQVLGAILSEDGYSISVAYSGLRALEIARTIVPDLILLDVMMPGMNGYTACERLKADEKTKGIPVIFVSAKIEPEDVVTGLKAGGVDYISKPFDASELLLRVSKQLAIKSLQESLRKQIAQTEKEAEKNERHARENESFIRHELNNAMSPILGYADLLIENRSVPEPKQIEWLSRIKTNVENMHHLLHELKHLQEVEHGHYQLEKTAVNLRTLILVELDAAQRSDRPDCKFEVDFGEAPLFVMGEQSFLQSVFRNLIKNAIEHTESIPAQDKHLKISARCSDDFAIVHLSNGGVPIPENRLVTFFDKFNSTKRDKGGTGLGTSFARIVVQAHEGEISVRSNSEDGTTITIRLPLLSS